MVNSLVAPEKTESAIKTHSSKRSRFIGALPIFALLICTALCLPPRSSRDSYLAAMIDKMKRLNSTVSPRIILVGGSNLAFGIDSVSLEKTFHLPVVNLGLHGAFGLRYILNQVKPHIRKGDLVIVAAEYQLLNESTNGKTELFDLMYVYPQAASALSLEHSEILLRAVGTSLRKKIEWWGKRGLTMPGADSVYARSKFNEQGDLVLTTADRGREQHLHVMDFDKTRGLENIKLLKELSQIAIARGAKVYFAFTPIPFSTYGYPGNKLTLDKAVQELQEKSGCIVLGRPEDNLYPISDFYDFDYHLTSAGKAVRTKLLIRDLKKTDQRLLDNRSPYK